TFGWRDDPRKDDAWYAKQKATKDAVLLAQELEMDFTASIEGIAIPALWVRAAVDLELPKSGGKPVLGMDIAEEGDNQTVLIPRFGPVIGVPIGWQHANTTATAWRARDHAHAMLATEVYYDCVGVGAGVRGTWQTASEPLRFTPIAINTGDAPTDARWPDGKSSKEKFVNLRAELWWKLRTRFERTYEYREKGIKHPVDELISIPNHQQLVAELSMALVEQNDKGKIQIESKKKMKARGIKSPDFADALCLAFAENPARQFNCSF
ncbi:MAG TPA: hypothetical protein VK832_09535, partial [Burkholderiaceae bacterium]|nr:hypothetical protein [Burkholderiaceae bacterium]